MTYKLTNSTSIIRTADGAFIPADPANTDYQRYLEWLAEGNTPMPVDPPAPEQIMARLETRVQQWLDEQARALGYDDIKSAVTYAEEPAVPKFQQEGQAMRRLRSLAWARCYEILNAVQAGQRSIPTEAELIAEMEALK